MTSLWALFLARNAVACRLLSSTVLLLHEKWFHLRYGIRFNQSKSCSSEPLKATTRHTRTHNALMHSHVEPWLISKISQKPFSNPSWVSIKAFLSLNAIIYKLLYYSLQVRLMGTHEIEKLSQWPYYVPFRSHLRSKFLNKQSDAQWLCDPTKWLSKSIC